MKFLSFLLILFGFCLGTLGSAGFHTPTISATPNLLQQAADEAMQEKQGDPEATAPPVDTQHLDKKSQEERAPLLFGIGLAMLLAGGVIAKQSKKSQALVGTALQEGRSDLLQRIESIRDRLSALSVDARELPPEKVRDALTDLNEGKMYDLVSEFERWIEVLGFDDYAKIWAGVANGERLSNRAWTLYTDGFPNEARQELVLATQAFDEAYRSGI